MPGTLVTTSRLTCQRNRLPARRPQAVAELESSRRAATKRSTLSGQPRYAELAVELVQALRLSFHLALRQVKAFTRSVLALLGLELPTPDHTPLFHRGRAFGGR